MYLRRVLRNGAKGTDRRRDAVQERGGLPGPDAVLCHLSHPGATGDAFRGAAQEMGNAADEEQQEGQEKDGALPAQAGVCGEYPELLPEARGRDTAGRRPGEPLRVAGAKFGGIDDRCPSLCFP